MKNNKAIVLFSGGLDSTTCLAYAKAQGYECYTLSFQYGQKHQIEVENARKLAKAFGVIEHKSLSLPLHEIRGSSLTDPDMAVKDYQGDVTGIPDTYVPARNTIFLSMALAWGEVLDAANIFIGVNQVDYSGYPDCRREYLEAFEKLASLATRIGVEAEQTFKIHTPLLHMTKAGIIREGHRLGIDYSQTISCYRADAEGRACGTCDSCTYRRKGFADAGVEDPTRYFG